VLVVAGDRAVEQHGLGLEEREQPIDAALAADAGLLEAAVPNVEVGLEAVVADDAVRICPATSRARSTSLVNTAPCSP